MPRPSSLLSQTLALSAAALALSAAETALAEVELSQTFAIKPGWNAVYVEVAPTNTLDAVFADWPTDSVGLYDPASFLATRQQTAASESQNLTESPIAMWHRDHPDATDAITLPAGTVCIFFNTAAAATVTLHGVPAAPRTTWHVTGPKKPYNFFGLSLQPGATVTVGDYLDGFPGIASLSGIYRISGVSADTPPTLTRLYSTTKLSDGEVLLVPSSEISDWSGVLFVSPMGGLDYGTNATLRVLTVRNDSTLERTAGLELVDVAGSRPLLGALHLRDTAQILTNAAWTTPTTAKLATKTLAPGETWRLQVGLDRSLFDSDVRGTPFGAVLRITDDGGASKLRVDVPLQGAASGKAATRDAWPGGLWLVEAALDTIAFDGDPASGKTAAGGVMKIRLPMHIDAEGRSRLLQRVVVAGTTDADGAFSYALYAGEAEVPTTSRETMRISSAVLPTETPVLESTVSALEAGIVGFDFTVAEDGSTSLLRHPTHPQHDGLRWDFATPLPSGDDFANYVSTQKPELFSVTNTVLLVLDLKGDETPWNPDDTKSGACTWILKGLRREGAITLSGAATFRRIAPQTELILQ